MTVSLPALTVLSALENVELGNVRNWFYAPEPPLDKYLHVSQWDDANLLSSVLTDIQQRRLGSGTFKRIDIVAHSLLEGNVAIGILMKDRDRPSIAARGDGWTGQSCFRALVDYAADDVELRIIVCDGTTLPHVLTSGIARLLKDVRPKGRLLVPKGPVMMTHLTFGNGGFVGDAHVTFEPVT
jgi:hypothetical protein